MLSFYNSVMKRKIVIIEDSTDARSVAALLESTDKYNVLIADNIIDFNKIGEVLPDIILLDAQLENGGTNELCIQLKNNQGTKEIPVIILADKNSISDNGYHCSADDVIHKPYTPHDLGAKIDLWLGRN